MMSAGGGMGDKVYGVRVERSNDGATGVDCGSSETSEKRSPAGEISSTSC